MERLLRGLKVYGSKPEAPGISDQPQQAQAPSPRVAPQGAPGSGAMREPAEPESTGSPQPSQSLNRWNEREQERAAGESNQPLQGQASAPRVACEGVPESKAMGGAQSPEVGGGSLMPGPTEPESKASLQPSKSLNRWNLLEQEEGERALQRQALLVDLAMPTPQRKIDIKGAPWNKEKASIRFKESERQRLKQVKKRLAKLTANELAVMKFVLQKRGTIEEIAGKLGLVGPVSRLSADDCARVGRHLEADTIELITKELGINAKTARQCRTRAFHKMRVNTADELAALLRCTGVTLAGPGKA